MASSKQIGDVFLSICCQGKASVWQVTEALQGSKVLHRVGLITKVAGTFVGGQLTPWCELNRFTFKQGKKMPKRAVKC